MSVARWCVLVLALPCSAMASVVSEMASNDTSEAAQLLEGQFSSGPNADAPMAGEAGWEWVSVEATGDDTLDFFAFDVTPEHAADRQRVWLDIDYGDGAPDYLDAALSLYRPDGRRHRSVDDLLYYDEETGQDRICYWCGLDPGSSTPFDPILSINLTVPGRWVVRVSNWDNTGVEAGSAYTLSISRNGAMAVPEPATGLMLTLAGFGAGFAARRRTSRLQAGR